MIDDMTQFHERASELGEIETVLGKLADGSGGGALVVEGAVGFGKSRVMTRTASAAADRGVTVAMRRATEFDHKADMSTLLTTLGGCPPIASLVSGLSELSDNGLLLLDRLGERLDRIAQTRTLLIGIDDVELGDELTALALQVLIPALASRPVLWVLSRRPATGRDSSRAAVHRAVDALVTEGARRVELGVLSSRGIEQLCRDVLGGWCLSRGGHPVRRAAAGE